MAGNELARFHIGTKQLYIWKYSMIVASAGSHYAMHKLILEFKRDYVSRESIDSVLTAYNNCCAEMRSDARDTSIDIFMRIDRTGGNKECN